MKKKRLLQDPALWVLIAVNVYLVYHYYQHPEIFKTLIWLYWSQSMLLGLFTALDLLTVKKTIPITFRLNNVIKTIQDDKRSRRASAKTFLWGYGILHGIYLLFIVVLWKDKEPIQWNFFKYFFFAFLAGQMISFIQHKAQQRRRAIDTGPIIFSPFIRALPMHLTIILASFFPSQGIGIFLIFKTLADVAMYIATKPVYQAGPADTAIMSMQQNMNTDI